MTKKLPDKIVLPSRETVLRLALERSAELSGAMPKDYAPMHPKPKPKRKAATRVPSVETEWGKRVMERMGHGDVRLYRQNSAKIVIPNGDGTTRCLTAGPEKGCADLTGNDCITGLRIEIELKMPGKKRTPEQVAWANRMISQNVIYQQMTYDDKVSLQENLDREQKEFESKLFEARLRCGYARVGGNWSGCLRAKRIVEGASTGLYVVSGGGSVGGHPWSFTWGDHGFTDDDSSVMVFVCPAENEHHTAVRRLPAGVGAMLRTAWEFIEHGLLGLGGS